MPRRPTSILWSLQKVLLLGSTPIDEGLVLNKSEEVESLFLLVVDRQACARMPQSKL